MTISGGSALPKEDIDRMVKEAEAHAEEDKKRREDAETRNIAEQQVYSIDKLLKENKDIPIFRFDFRITFHPFVDGTERVTVFFTKLCLRFSVMIKADNRLFEVFIIKVE